MILDRIRLEDGLNELGISVRANAVDVIECLCRELEVWKVRGFVGDENILGRHILDCAAGFSYFANSDCHRIADLGSGAGFPGIVLAALLPERQFVLVESSSNRSAFLSNVCALAKLDNVAVMNSRMEEVHEVFDLITWRAFRRLADIERTLVKLLGKDGRIAAYKGRRTAIDQELRESRYQWKRIDVAPLDVPGLHAERNLLILEL